jgi:hypothetical protein
MRNSQIEKRDIYLCDIKKILVDMIRDYKHNNIKVIFNIPKNAAPEKIKVEIREFL